MGRTLQPKPPCPRREGREFVQVAMSEGVKVAVVKRDGPFGDYSQAPKSERPRKRSEL